MLIPYRICNKCIAGGLMFVNDSSQEYYNRHIYISTNYWIDTCNCFHGKFVEGYYKFPKTLINNYRKLENGDIIVTIDNIDISFRDILQNWIKHKSCTRSHTLPKL